MIFKDNMDSLEKRIRILFGQCRRGEVQGQQSDNEYDSIRKDYYKVLEDSDEKVQLASQMYDLVERYFRRLDSELYKFKCELEADHNGITEILEKRSLELDGVSTNSTSLGNQKENRYFGVLSSSNSSQRDNRYRPKPEKRRDSSSGTTSTIQPPEKRQAISNSIGTPTVRPTTPNLIHHQVIPAVVTTPIQPPVSYSLHNLGAGNAIAAAATAAIAATQQMQQGRRTASLKASYEAIHGTPGTAAAELLIGRDLTGTGHATIQSVDRDNSFNNQRRHKKKLTTASSSSSNQSSQSSIILPTTSHQQPIQTIVETPPVLISESGLIVEQTVDGEWTYDPNEPRYCICNQVSYGDMVACDNEDVSLIFFSFFGRILISFFYFSVHSNGFIILALA